MSEPHRPSVNSQKEEMETQGGLLKSTSVIVCTVDRLPDLEECLKSLAPFKAWVADIIVVNNGPRLKDVEEVARRHGATVVNEPQRGVSRARNAGIQAATGSIMAFLDDDSVADPNWLPLLLAPFHDPQVLAVSGSISAQTLADPVSQTFDYLHRAEFPASQQIIDGHVGAESFPMRSALVGNANMAIRREVFQRYGDYDARFGRGTRIGSGEEPDLLLRILLGGGRIVVEPAAKILHRHPTEWRAVRRWAFQSGCAHTAILTKYFLQEPTLRGAILRYAASRMRRQTASGVSRATKSKVPRIPLLIGSLYGPIAFILSGKK
ncbi:MAG: glycosyltransferase family 2 protein [Acidobacteriota bacterium]|nr:glycosyltransferase family 2 protein [Acidobacteriota bacterium]